MQFENYGLCVCPPDSLPVPPLQLISNNIYVNDVYYTNIPVIIPEDTVCCLVDQFCNRRVVDDGPAIDGHGNMINFGGWQTLLQINPELDYNWNIKFHVLPCAGCSHLKYYEIYRRVYNGYELLDTTWNQETYTDTTTDQYGLYSYKIKAVYYHETDTCYSLFSNTASDWLPGVESIPGKLQITVFPNPASDYIKISSDVMLERVEIYNGVGDKVFDVILKEKEIILPVSGFSSGLFFLVIHSANGTESRKVVIM